MISDVLQMLLECYKHLEMKMIHFPHEVFSAKFKGYCIKTFLVFGSSLADTIFQIQSMFVSIFSFTHRLDVRQNIDTMFYFVKR